MISEIHFPQLLGGILLMASAVFFFEMAYMGMAICDSLVGGYLIFTATHSDPPFGVG